MSFQERVSRRSNFSDSPPPPNARKSNFSDTPLPNNPTENSYASSRLDGTAIAGSLSSLYPIQTGASDVGKSDPPANSVTTVPRDQDFAALHYGNYKAGQAPSSTGGKVYDDYEQRPIGLGEHVDQWAAEHDDVVMQAASMDRPIESSNVGYRLLQRMGWQSDGGLGRAGHGRKEPIRIDLKDDKLGLGKKEEDELYTDAVNVSRKVLEIERHETPELAKRREETKDKIEKIRDELTMVNSVFYCELCSKQYKLAVEMEKHLDSYDHHHKKRFAETQKVMQYTNREEKAKKDAASLDKEMKRFQAAAAALAAQKQQQQQSSSPTSMSISPTPLPSDSTRNQNPSEAPGPSNSNTGSAIDIENRTPTLKFGFAKTSSAKPSLAKKPRT